MGQNAMFTYLGETSDAKVNHSTAIFYCHVSHTEKLQETITM